VFRAKSASVRTASVAAVVTAAASFAPGHALADDTGVCLSTYVDAQRQRRDGHLRAAHSDVEQCGRASCPAVIRRDCVQWERELDEAIPTIVLSARAPDGRELSDVHVLIDGAPLVDRLDGRAVAVDPGEHVFRFVFAEGAIVERRALVSEGEHRRPVTAAWPSAPAATTTVTAPTAPAQVSGSGASSRPVPTAVWILGGAGAGAGIVAAVFWSLAAFGNHGLSSELSCRPGCPSGSSSEMTQRALIGDVAGGVALLGLGTAFYLYLTRPQGGPPPAMAIGVGPGSVLARWTTAL
jgi:hypothetical protein